MSWLRSGCRKIWNLKFFSWTKICLFLFFYVLSRWYVFFVLSLMLFLSGEDRRVQKLKSDSNNQHKDNTFFQINLLLLLLLSLYVFFTKVVIANFHWSPCNSKFPLRSIPANFDSGVIWVVSILTLVASSFSLLSRLLGSLPFTTGVPDTFVFHSFFSSQRKYLHNFSLFFTFTQWSVWTAKSTRW